MLNFNAPLLSTRTRRFAGNPPTSLKIIPCTDSSSASRISTSDRIPFSWEQSPGKPKHLGTPCINHHHQLQLQLQQQQTPPPNLPPSWWGDHQEEEEEEEEGNDDIESYYDEEDVRLDGDIGDMDVSSDAAVDVLSLSEAMDIVEKKSHLKADAIDGLKLKLAADCGGEVTPNFIIQRFLPDATALAVASSTTTTSSPPPSGLLMMGNYEDDDDDDGNWYSERESNNTTTRSRSSGGRARMMMRQQKQQQQQHYSSSSYSPPKGCGLEVLSFPWRMKHKLCGVKSPVRHDSSLTALQKHHQKPKVLHRKH